jgi:hypothetical protein
MWHTMIVSPVTCARAASSFFHSRSRMPWLLRSQRTAPVPNGLALTLPIRLWPALMPNDVRSKSGQITSNARPLSPFQPESAQVSSVVLGPDNVSCERKNSRSAPSRRPIEPLAAPARAAHGAG